MPIIEIMTNEFLTVVNKAYSFMFNAEKKEANTRMPNYVVFPSKPKYRCNKREYIDAMNRINSFLQKNSRLPKFVKVRVELTNLDTIIIPDEVKQYLTPTMNANSQDTLIKAKAIELTGKRIGLMDKAYAIFHYVLTMKDYDFYRNTRYGASKSLVIKAINCVDMAHLIIALARASGVPARYRHITARFKHGEYGHVMAELWVNNHWLIADATDNRNNLGTAVNYSVLQFKGVYREITF